MTMRFGLTIWSMIKYDWVKWESKESINHLVPSWELLPLRFIGHFRSSCTLAWRSDPSQSTRGCRPLRSSPRRRLAVQNWWVCWDLSACWWRCCSRPSSWGNLRGWSVSSHLFWRYLPFGKWCSRNWNLGCSTCRPISGTAIRRSTKAHNRWWFHCHRDPWSWTRILCFWLLFYLLRREWTKRSLRSPFFPNAETSWRFGRIFFPRSSWIAYSLNIWRVLPCWVENHDRCQVPRTWYRWHKNLHS